MESQGSFRIQADVIIASSHQHFAPGQVEIKDGRIVEVTGRLESTADAVLDGHALLPGLVNPHTHLEFSDLKSPLSSGENFPEWVGCVLAQRRERGTQSSQQLARTLALGLHESQRCGVAALVDVVTPPWSPNLLQVERILQTQSQNENPPELGLVLHPALPRNCQHKLLPQLPSGRNLPHVIACIEQLGLTADRIEHVTRWREELLSLPISDWPARLHSIGISPHAPYSTPELVWSECARLASEQQRLIAMHIAESPAEREWLDSGTGPFAAMLERFGIGKPQPLPNLIAALCDALAQAPHALLVHGNYLTTAEIDHLSTLRDRISVVYCPRTHLHFGHAAYPLSILHQRGVRVLFGTDSRSSNPDLNLWQEARCALAQHPWLAPSAALSAISDSAAGAVGLEGQFGSLQVDAVAALNVLPLPADMRPDNIEDLLATCFDNQANPQPLVHYRLFT